MAGVGLKSILLPQSTSLVVTQPQTGCQKSVYSISALTGFLGGLVSGGFFVGIGFALVNPWGEPRDHPGSGKTPIGTGSVGVLFFLASSLHL